jgi:hypothetical protein
MQTFAGRPFQPASFRRWACSIVIMACSACGGASNRTPTAISTPVPEPSSTPIPLPSPTPLGSPPPEAKCGNLAPGPVARVAVSPRQHDENGAKITMKVLVRTLFSDEVLCVDKDKDHKIDFNLNQRNLGGQEACWEGEPGWKVRDPGGIVTLQQVRDEHGFIFRVRISPGGERGRVGVSAELDRIHSHPWLSGQGYTPGPIWIEAMRKEELKGCSCVYLGNGGYEGEGCPKTGY